MTLTAKRADPMDAYELVLREEDEREVSDGWEDRVHAAIVHGDALSFRDASGRLIALFGVTYPDRDQASPWLLCATGVDRHAREVLRRGRKMVRAIRGIFPGHFIFNHIPKDAAGNRRFIEHLGFRIVPSPEGPDLFYLPHV